MKRTWTIVLAAAALAVSPALRAADDDHAQAHSGPEAAAPVASAAQYTEGEVRRIDKDTGRVTVRHAPIRNLEMPAMTMVFRVKDPVMLEGMKVGDKIMFVAERANGAFTITELKKGR